MRTETGQAPRTEAPSAAAVLIGWMILACAAIVVLFVAGVAGIALVWLARLALGV